MREMLSYASGGESYVVDSEGRISRYGCEPSGGWMMRGLKRRVGRSEFIPFETIKRDGLPERLFFKNGNPIYCIADSDHGTYRLQMSPGLTRLNMSPEWWRQREAEREAAFRACPILKSYVAAILEDLQHSEADEACSEGREARDSGTIYTMPESEFAKCRRSCERFAAENAEAIAAALELEPGRYSRGDYMTADWIGYYFHMMRVGHGVAFSDGYTPGEPDCIAKLDQAARTFGYSEGAYFGDDGRVYLYGGDA